MFIELSAISLSISVIIVIYLWFSSMFLSHVNIHKQTTKYCNNNRKVLETEKERKMKDAY